MTNVDEAFLALSIAYNKQFNLELDIAQDQGDIYYFVDGTSTGVTRVGSVSSNWLKRNAPRFGFFRQGETNAFQWSDSVIEHAVSAPVAAEKAEIAAVVTVMDVIKNDESEDEGNLPLHIEDDHEDIPLLIDNEEESDDR